MSATTTTTASPSIITNTNQAMDIMLAGYTQKWIQTISSNKITLKKFTSFLLLVSILDLKTDFSSIIRSFITWLKEKTVEFWEFLTSGEFLKKVSEFKFWAFCY